MAKGDTFTGEDIAKSIAASFGTNGTADYATYGVKLTATADGAKVTFTMDKAPTEAWGQSSAVDFVGVTSDYGNATSGVGNQAQGVQVTTVTKPVDSSASRKYAQAQLDLTQLDIADGTTLQIGDTTYTFAVGKESAYKGSSNVIDLTDMSEVDMTDTTTAHTVASRVTTAAQDNKNFKVTANSQVDSSKNTTKGEKTGCVYLTEKEGGVDTDNYKLEGTKNTSNATSIDGDWSGLVKFGKVDTANMGKALTLQIGDTSDDYNQLKVAVGDMHTSAMGIADLDISTQDGAAAAIQTIRDAINYVSSVRGDLGATQNRLEQTQNNLSVMAENIQDAESTIRDTDVAEEMMSYVKNNILVQSAQAMLAQANQVPQGVLQLLG